MEAITSVNDWWRCLCGNEADQNGFFPCDRQGNAVEPDQTWPGLYACDRCGRVVDQTSLRVVGRRADLTSGKEVR